MKRVYSFAILILILCLVASNFYLIDKVIEIENRVNILPTHVPNAPTYESQFRTLQTDVESVVYEVEEINKKQIKMNFVITMAKRLPNTELVFQYTSLVDNQTFDTKLEMIAPLKYSVSVEMTNKNYSYGVMQMEGEEPLTVFRQSLDFSNIGSELSLKTDLDTDNNLVLKFYPLEDAKIAVVDVILSDKTIVSGSNQAEVARRVFSSTKETDNHLVIVDNDEIAAYNIDDIELEMYIYLDNNKVIRQKYQVSDLVAEEVIIPLWNDN